MKGTTRNTDPFYIGRSDLNDKNTEAALKKIFSRAEYQQPRQPDKKIIDEVDRVAKYLYEYGEQPCSQIVKSLSIETEKIKTLLTYRYPVYESDDGRTMGILDKKGDPVYTDKNKLIIWNNHKELEFRNIQEAANFFETSYHTVKRLIDGNPGRTFRQYKARWNNG